MSNRSRINPPSKEERERMVREAIRILAKDVKLPAITDIEQLLLSFKRVISNVNAHLNAIDMAVRAAGDEHNRQHLKEEAQRMFLEQSMHYSKEELLLILVCVASDLSVKEIV